MGTTLIKIRANGLGCLLIALLVLVSNKSPAQTVQKSVFSCFYSPVTNDSIIAVGGQSTVGESAAPRILHGYLPLQYSQLGFEDGDRPSVRIFPNPTKDILNLEFSVQEEYEIHVYNMQGQQVLNAILESSFTQLDTEYLKSGIYLVEIARKEGVFFNAKFSKL